MKSRRLSVNFGAKRLGTTSRRGVESAYSVAAYLGAKGMMRLAAFCFAFLVIVIAVSFGVLSLSPSYNECIRNNGQHSTEQYTTDGQQIVEGAIDNPTGPRLLLHCGSFFANKNGEAFTGLFTVALTLATFLLGYLAWDQGRTTRAQLRAYVFIKSAGVGLNKADGKVLAHLKFKNFGATPAFKLAVYFALVPESAIADTSISPKPEIALGPGADMSISDGKPFDTFIKPGPTVDKAHVIGRVEYNDVFGVRRTTNFKLRYVIGAETGVEGLEPTEDGNGAD
jgi:hypothetical protein